MAPSYQNSKLLNNVTIRYKEPSSHYFSNWSPWVFMRRKSIPALWWADPALGSEETTTIEQAIYRGYIRVMEKKVATTVGFRAYEFGVLGF